MTAEINFHHNPDWLRKKAQFPGIYDRVAITYQSGLKGLQHTLDRRRIQTALLVGESARYMWQDLEVVTGKKLPSTVIANDIVTHSIYSGIMEERIAAFQSLGLNTSGLAIVEDYVNTYQKMGQLEDFFETLSLRIPIFVLAGTQRAFYERSRNPNLDLTFIVTQPDDQLVELLSTRESSHIIT